MDKVYDEYFDKIYNWSIKKTNNREDAEDLTNSVFLSIFEYLNKDINVEKLENLIWKIAYNIWCTRAKKYIKEKNNVNYDMSYELGYEDITIDKIIYREIIDDKLYVVVPFVRSDDKVWKKDSGIVPEYYSVIDPKEMKLLEFNKTTEKNFVIKDIKKNNSDGSFDKEISKYIVDTKLKYKNYIKDDIKNNELLSYQNKVSSILNSTEIDGKNVSFNDYFYANFDEEINKKVDELVDLISSVKYNSLTTYYDVLFTNIVNEYINDNKINEEKINLACEMMNTYYPGVDGISNIFYAI